MRLLARLLDARRLAPGLFNTRLLGTGWRCLAPGLFLPRLFSPLLVSRLLDPRLLDARLLNPRLFISLTLDLRAFGLLALNLVAQLLLQVTRPLRLLALRAVLLSTNLVLPRLLLTLPALTYGFVALLLYLAPLPVAILAHTTRQCFPIEHRRAGGRGGFALLSIYTRRAIQTLAHRVGHTGRGLHLAATGGLFARAVVTLGRARRDVTVLNRPARELRRRRRRIAPHYHLAIRDRLRRNANVRANRSTQAALAVCRDTRRNRVRGAAREILFAESNALRAQAARGRELRLCRCRHAIHHSITKRLVRGPVLVDFPDDATRDHRVRVVHALQVAPAIAIARPVRLTGTEREPRDVAAR